MEHVLHAREVGPLVRLFFRVIDFSVKTLIAFCTGVRFRFIYMQVWCSPIQRSSFGLEN